MGHPESPQRRLTGCSVGIIYLFLKPYFWYNSFISSSRSSAACLGRYIYQNQNQMRHKNISVKVLLTLAASAFLIQLITGTTFGQARSNNYERITIAGETANKGVYDPSIEYNQDGSVGWLVYSALESPDDGRKLLPIPKTIATHLAKSTDHGKTWKFISELNSSAEATVTINGKTINGVWWNEVPTLVHDPNDPGREWKLFWHKYFAIPKPYFRFPVRAKGSLIRVPQYMWIAYKYAKTPEELATAKEVILFGAGKLPVAPYKAEHNLNEILSWPDAKAYSEPGSLYNDGVIYLSLSGFTGPDFKHDKLFLLVTFDHARTWKYVGELIDYNDAANLGYIRFTGSSLVEENGRVFLLVAPVKLKNNKGIQLGTYVFEFEDISKAKLKRAKRGNLIVYKYLKRSLPEELNSGQSDYDKYNTYGGIIMPQGDLSSAPAYAQIFNTKEGIINKQLGVSNDKK